MEIDDLRAMATEDLGEELAGSSKGLMNLRFRAATMQLADVNEISRVRKRIARIKTLMRERDLARGAR